MSGRELVSSLLLLVALFALVTMPAGVGQSLTTIVTTITTPVTTVATVKSTVGSTQGLSTVFHTAAYTTLFVIQPTGGTYACYQQAYGPFTLTEGEALSFDVTSNIPISIYIMTANDYQAWVKGSTCAAGSSVLYSRQQVSSDYIDMIAPSSGDYYLVLLNFSPTSSASVNVGYTDISQAVSVPVPVVTEFATTETQTATSRLTEVQPVTEPLQQYGLYVIILVLVLALGFLALRSRLSKKPVGTATVAAEQASPIGGKFCGDCGKPIPIDAEFCPECGASTEDG